MSVQPHVGVGMSDALGRPVWLDPMEAELSEPGSAEAARASGSAARPARNRASGRSGREPRGHEGRIRRRWRLAESRTYHVRNRHRRLAGATRVGRAGGDVPCGAAILGIHWPGLVAGCSRRGWVARLTTLARGTESRGKRRRACPAEGLRDPGSVPLSPAIPEARSRERTSGGRATRLAGEPAPPRSISEPGVARWFDLTTVSYAARTCGRGRRPRESLQPHVRVGMSDSLVSVRPDSRPTALALPPRARTLAA